MDPRRSVEIPSPAVQYCRSVAVLTVQAFFLLLVQAQGPKNIHATSPSFIVSSSKVATLTNSPRLSGFALSAKGVLLCSCHGSFP